MNATLLIGFAVVLLGAGLGAFLMFGQRAKPLVETSDGTLSRDPGGPPVQLAMSSGAVPVGGDVRIRWWEKLRSGLVLTLITVGIGMSIGAVLGVAALALNLLMS